MSRKFEIIKDVVAEKLKVDRLDMVNGRRFYEVVEARQIAIYLMLQNSDCTYEEVGESLGGKSPATVLHNFRKISNRVYCEKDEGLGLLLMEIQKEVLFREAQDDPELYRGAGI